MSQDREKGDRDQRYQHIFVPNQNGSDVNTTNDEQREQREKREKREQLIEKTLANLKTAIPVLEQAVAETVRETKRLEEKLAQARSLRAFLESETQRVGHAKNE